MTRYRNLQGHSGVTDYEEAPGAITVRFVSGDSYVYTDASAGPAAVAHMKTLARAGRGLSTFIAQHVRERYASRAPAQEQP